MSEKLQGVVNELSQIEGLKLELIGKWLWIGGKTKENKDKIKSFGALWCKTKSLWYIKPDDSKRMRIKTKDHEVIRNYYGSVMV